MKKVREFRYRSHAILLKALKVAALRSVATPLLVVLAISICLLWSGSAHSAGDSFDASAAFDLDASAGIASGTTAWKPINSGLLDIDVQCIAMDPARPLILYAGTRSGRIFRTTNGGRSWSMIHPGLPSIVTSLAIDPKNTRTLYAGLMSGPGGISKSVDAGRTWKVIPYSPYPEFITILPQKPNIIYVNGHKSIDAGETWSNMNEDNGLPSYIHNNNFTVFNPRANNVLYANIFLDVYKTIDGGKNWSKIDTELQEDLYDIPAMVIDSKSPGTLYVGTWRAGVIKSTDGGLTWNTANSGMPRYYEQYPVETLSIDPRNTRTLYAYIEGMIFKSINGARTWQEADSGLPYGPYNTPVIVDPSNPNTLYIGTKQGVYKSTTGGM